MGRAMDLYCESFQRVPKRITLDIDDTFDAVHGGQQLRLFRHCDEYGFQPIVVFDGEGRFVTAVLRPAKRPGGKEVRAFLRRLLRAIRANWPKTETSTARRQSLLQPGSPTGVGPTVSITSWASRRPRHCAGISGISRPARKPASRMRRTTARRAAWASSLTGPCDLEPRRAHHRPRQPVRTGPTRLHRHQSRHPQCARAL